MIPGFLYEKDLRMMKLRILQSPRHAAVVVAIAERYGLSKQETRKILMSRCDMILLENLPARYEEAVRVEEEVHDPDTAALGALVITKAIPLVDRAVMDAAIVTIRSAGKTEREEAVSAAIAAIREAIRS
jgi:energy-converting hydrogenase A subunit M